MLCIFDFVVLTGGVVQVGIVRVLAQSDQTGLVWCVPVSRLVHEQGS